MQREENLLPIGLITGNVTVNKDIKKGEALKYSDVSLDESSTILKLRRKQDELF